MKTKNNYFKKPKSAINLLKLSKEENVRLKKSNQIKDIKISSLEIKEKELSDKIYSLYNKVEKQTKLSNDNYNAWLEEHKTNGKLSVGLTVMSFIITGLIVTLIGFYK